MTSSAETQFLKDRQRLRTMLLGWLDTFEEKLALQPDVITSKDLARDGHHHELPALQEIAYERTYEKHRVGYIIGNTPTWEPLVTIISDLEAPRQFTLMPGLSNFAEVQLALAAAVRHVKSADARQPI